MDVSKLIDRLKEHEGSKQFVYKDSLGYFTIGIGRCIDSRIGRGLTADEQIYLLKNDINLCIKQLSVFEYYLNLDEVRQGALIELVFNMGLANFMSFKKTIAAIKAHDFVLAEKELRDSKWATQVSYDRVNNICYRLRYGAYPG